MTDPYDLLATETRRTASRAGVRSERALARTTLLDLRRERRRHAMAGRLRSLASRLEN